MLRYLTAGESHGPGLLTIVEGMPYGFKVDTNFINNELSRRQLGFGRGMRMQIEGDKVEVVSGIRFGKTLGSPVAFLIRNKDWENWTEIMKIEEGEAEETLTKPRPGHADLAGLQKINGKDIRDILERSSARETTARVAAGALAKLIIAELDIYILSHVTNIGGCKACLNDPPLIEDIKKIDSSPVRCLDEKAGSEMVEIIRKAIDEKETLGGTFEIIVYGAPPGLGSYVHWDKKLDAKIAQALMSIQAIKGVEFGEGFNLANLKGSDAHDEIFYNNTKKFYRKTNRAGGIEGGMTNGEPVVIKAVMKPIPTLGKPLMTVDMKTKEAMPAFKERSDVCAVPSAAVIGESVVAIEIANAALEKFGGDSIGELKSNYNSYLKRLKEM
ncbi:MAG: chorismate synthase [Actinobacteria bacterium]|nr:chorismate synthase [Actinomycetota bacterium]